MRYLPLSVLVLLTAIPGTPSQQPDAPDPVCTANFSQLIVEQQVDESRSVDTRKRVMILIRAADFLWQMDETVARRYFEEAFRLAIEHFAEKGRETQKAEGKYGLITELSDLRFDVIKAVAKRDPKLAQTLSDKLFDEYEKSDKSSKDNDPAPSGLLAIAGESAGSNKALSLYLFRRVMRYPLFNGWYYALFSAAEADQRFGDQIYREALTAFRNEKPSRLLYLSAYPFGRSRIIGFEKYSMGMQIPNGLSPDPALGRYYLSVFFDRVNAFAADSNETSVVVAMNTYPPPEAVYMSSALSEMEQIIIERYSDLLQRFSVARAHANAMLTDEMRKMLASNMVFQNRTGSKIDDLIRQAEEDDSNGKLTDWQIVTLATYQTKTEAHFKEIEPFLPKIQNVDLRRESMNYFWFLRSELALKDGRMEDAEACAAKVPEIDHRATLYFQLAKRQLSNPNSVSEAFDTLNRLSKLARSAPNSVAKVQVLLGLAEKYEKLNHTIALDELAEAIRVANQLPNEDLLTTSVIRTLVGNGYVHYAVYQLPGGNLENVFNSIGENDVEMSLANARSIHEKYYRVLAVLAIAKNCLRKADAGPRQQTTLRP